MTTRTIQQHLSRIPEIVLRFVVTTIVLGFSVSLASADDPILKVDGGRIRGVSREVEGKKVSAYLGIPFAAPPTRKLRWRPPQPVKSWKGIKKCDQFAPACPQPPGLSYGYEFKNQSEDCLYLNVWTPTLRKGKLPVMVWIHGGGNLIGGTEWPVYDGEHFAASGVVFVTIQYRLGPFGYFSHPALTAEAKKLDGRETCGNYGLLDQIAALKWVQQNIHNFGGDKNKVTLFGESAGAANVTYLMASPLAKGLFHQAIAQSGYYGEYTPSLRKRVNGNLSGHKNGLAFGERFGIKGTDAKSLAALRRLSVEKMSTVPLMISGAPPVPGRFTFGPIVDGYVLPEDPSDVWAAGRMHKLPLIAGSNLDDGSVFSRNRPITTWLAYQFALQQLFGKDAGKARKLFPVNDTKDVPAAVHKIATLMAFRAPARRLVRAIQSTGKTAWLYHFSRNPKSPKSLREGVFHALEVGYVFRTNDFKQNQIDKHISQQMHQRWVNFARFGNPNGKPKRKQVAPVWPNYTAKQDQHLEFGDRVTIDEHLDAEYLELMDRAAERMRAKNETLPQSRN
ncbi:MAG: carboxylesterase/lipase family protein [Gemmataceae bacterium]